MRVRGGEGACAALRPSLRYPVDEDGLASHPPDILKRPAGSQQPLGQFAAVEDQFSQGLVNVVVFDDQLVAFSGGEERGLAHQFADEGTAHALGLVDQLRQVFELQGQALTVEVEETLAASAVGEWHLNGLVDASGPGGQRSSVCSFHFIVCFYL